jgi:hypothetical protein
MDRLPLASLRSGYHWPHMKTLSAAILALSCSVFAVSCLQSQTPESSTEAQSSNAAEPTATGETREPLPIVGTFGSNDFSFVTTIEDDGEGDGGGWQEAQADLPFARLLSPQTWHYYLTVGMPLRTMLLGRISPSRAAILSAQVATATGRSLSYKLPPGTFCNELEDGMRALFAAQPGLGARVTMP